ncbi:Hypothetical Protein FCC1311_026732 [Hondaea fermentalgiana]|uniref:Selenoprotein W n=1 Tax=Hondaea fermentalgiana TaxID=2315210 RepID=A0A2R5G5W7_9STRA|nr:Hypothetical Protein FCC1311_026732 [Hondaea fermentalgiana]|eukprot:GBG26452.1 Hypothetical Protein FCC1311_026732 [Hondaea fermentalgiana]
MNGHLFTVIFFFCLATSSHPDGGRQELNTAKQSVLAVLPDAEITEEGADTYPIRVSVEDAEGNVIWSGDQRRLFRKYASKRAAAIEEIKAAVQAHFQDT